MLSVERVIILARVFFEGALMIRAVIVAFFLAVVAHAQSLQSRADEIRAAMDARDFDRAEQLARSLKASDHSAFTRNN